MKKWYEGKRTHIANAIEKALYLAVALGVSIDPETTMAMIQQWDVLIGGFIVAMGGTISYLRELGKK